jgi:hypothetical protein
VVTRGPVVEVEEAVVVVVVETVDVEVDEGADVAVVSLLATPAEVVVSLGAAARLLSPSSPPHATALLTNRARTTA